MLPISKGGGISLSKHSANKIAFSSFYAVASLVLASLSCGTILVTVLRSLMANLNFPIEK